MQRKLAIKLHQLLIPSSLEPRFLAYRGCRTDHSRSVVGRTPPDPKIRNENPDETYDLSDPSNKSLPYQSNPRIERPAVIPPPNPFTQQKRHNSTQARNEDIICVGLDGSPFPVERNSNRRDVEEEEDDKEYFKHHKASPLSELEIADTRKPITKAIDGTAGDYVGGGVLVWRPEQIDTAEDSLRRAMEIWKENAMRGDPESPHGRVLRSLRGEYW